MWHLLLAVPLIAHGLAHLAGFVGTVTTGPTGFPDRAWVFSPTVTLHSRAGRAFGVLWLAAVVALVG